MTGHCFKQVTEVVDDETKTRFLYSPMLIDSNVNADPDCCQQQR